MYSNDAARSSSAACPGWLMTAVAPWGENAEDAYDQGLVELGNLNGLKEKTMDLVYKDEVKPKTNTFTSERMISSTLQVYRDLLSKPS